MSHVLSDDVWQHIVRWCDPYPALRWVDRRLWRLLRGRDVLATLHHGNDIDQLNAYVRSVPRVHTLRLRLAGVLDATQRDRIPNPVEWPSDGLTVLDVELQAPGAGAVDPWFRVSGLRDCATWRHLRRLRLVLPRNALTTADFVDLWNATLGRPTALTHVELDAGHNDLHDAAALAPLRPVVYPTHLRLVLTGNIMQSAGVSVVLRALHPRDRPVSHLRHLSLALTDTGLGDDAVGPLAALWLALRTAPARLSWYLDNNHLSHSGLVYLLVGGLADADRTVEWRSLTLDVSDNQIHLTAPGPRSSRPGAPAVACNAPQILAFRAALWLLLRRADMPHLDTLDLRLTNNHLSGRSQLNGFPDGHCPRSPLLFFPCPCGDRARGSGPPCGACCWTCRTATSAAPTCSAFRAPSRPSTSSTST